MVTTMNRQVKTGFDAKKDGMTLEVVKECRYFGKLYRAGEVIAMSKSEARRLLATLKDSFRIKVVD